MRTVLELLSGGEYVSGEVMSRELGVSRAAIWKKIAALKDEGWQIEAGGKRGYRLITGDRLEPDLWLGSLTTSVLGRGDVRYLHSVSSTNTFLKQMALEGAPAGSLCLCETQDAGKGRLGRSWFSSAGTGLWQSVLLRPSLSPADAPLLTLVTAMAMARAIEQTSGLAVRIKWPNDLIFDGRKLCGILLEATGDLDRLESVIVGVGVNVRKGAFPEELKDRAASIEDFTAPPLRRVLLVHYLSALEKLTERLERDGFAGIRDDYRALSCTLGQRVQVSGSVTLTGTAADLDSTGALVVQTDDGQLHRVLSGDVSVRGVMGYV